ncbi:unnamed protein product, partial [Meganyctiphanes norvegica]
MAGVECEICFNYFDEIERRAKNLPCGHTFCLTCMETSFAKGNQLCHLCRTPHNAESIDNLPFNFRLEDLIRTKYNRPLSKTEEDEGFVNGKCIKHANNKRLFLCQTHSLYICAECMLDDHKLGECQLKSYKDELLERKEELKVIVDENISLFETREKKLKEKICTKDNNIESAAKEIKRLQLLINSNEEEIKKETEIKEKYTSVLMETQLKLKSFEIAKEKLDNAKKKRTILEVSDIIDQDIQSLNDLLLSTIHNSEDICEDLDHFGEKKFFNLDYIQLQVLQSINIQNYEQVSIKHGKILGLLPNTLTVFMTISVSDVQIGTVYIKLTCPPQWMKHMIQLCTNSNGKTFKGANFDDVIDKSAKGERIFCRKYVENGSSTSSTSFIPSLEEETCDGLYSGVRSVYSPTGQGLTVFRGGKRHSTDVAKIFRSHAISEPSKTQSRMSYIRPVKGCRAQAA